MLDLPALLQQVRNCQLCAAHLPLGPKPILRAHTAARLLIVGQAPGIQVHKTGIPWNDPSGERLRSWLALDCDTFYDESKIAIIPMGYCYPGTGPSGDYPPRKECAQHWLSQLLSSLPNIQLTLLIGCYAQRHYLMGRIKSNLTHTVQAFKEYLPYYLPLPHPSPRNNLWFRRNTWFQQQVIPTLREYCQRIL